MVSHVFTGATYKYTTYGWTLLGAVIEAASGMEYLKYMKRCVFKPLGMSSTGPEYHKPLMYHRARYVWGWGVASFQRSASILRSLCCIHENYGASGQGWGGGMYLVGIPKLCLLYCSILTLFPNTQ